MPLALTLAESALQRVPKEIQAHPQIVQYAKRRGKKPGEVLLDRAYHHAAMLRLPKARAETMGRPDIVHTTLLQVLETPLNWAGQLKLYVHTQDDHVITINPKIRLPKNYIRFVGLIEELFAAGRVPDEGEILLRLDRMRLLDLVRKSSPSRVIGFSTLGTPMLMRDVAQQAAGLKEPMVLVGAFPRGHFSRETGRLFQDVYRVDRERLSSWVVAGRFVYDFEWAIGVAQQRLKRSERENTA